MNSVRELVLFALFGKTQSCSKQNLTFTSPRLLTRIDFGIFFLSKSKNFVNQNTRTHFEGK